ncbi:hypothetical protein BDY24DRAFT_384771 [Mrakia frigida]|uniref:uncharacterized protein n=1 Tax=Mrakia frigida TaxID=29902 RepID=UPI003FCC0D60
MHRTRRSPAEMRVAREGVGREAEGQGDVDLRERRGRGWSDEGAWCRVKEEGSSSSSPSNRSTRSSRRRSQPINSILLVFLIVLGILTLLPSSVVGSPLPTPDDPFLIFPPDPIRQPDDSPFTTKTFDWWPYGEKTMTRTTEEASPTPTMVESDEDASTTMDDDLSSSMFTSSVHPSHHQFSHSFQPFQVPRYFFISYQTQQHHLLWNPSSSNQILLLLLLLLDASPSSRSLRLPSPTSLHPRRRLRLR